MLPTAQGVRALLESRLGRSVAVRPASPLPPAVGGLTFGVYVDRHLATQALLVADRPAAAYLGAAAALAPAGTARAALAGRGLPRLLADGLRGELESVAALFRPDRAGAVAGGSALRLYSLTSAPDLPPDDVLALAAAVGRRLDVEIDIRAYGAGRLSFVSGR